MKRFKYKICTLFRQKWIKCITERLLNLKFQRNGGIRAVFFVLNPMIRIKIQIPSDYAQILLENQQFSQHYVLKN